MCERNKNRTKPLLTGPTSLEMVINPVRDTYPSIENSSGKKRLSDSRSINNKHRADISEAVTMMSNIAAVLHTHDHQSDVVPLRLPVREG